MMYLHYSEENQVTCNDLIGTNMSEMSVEYRKETLINDSFNLKGT